MLQLVLTKVVCVSCANFRLVKGAMHPTAPSPKTAVAINTIYNNGSRRIVRSVFESRKAEHGDSLRTMPRRKDAERARCSKNVQGFEGRILFSSFSRLGEVRQSLHPRVQLTSQKLLNPQP